MCRVSPWDFRHTPVILSGNFQDTSVKLTYNCRQAFKKASKMLALRNREGAVKAEIPKALYMAIVRLQAAESLDWEDACVRAAELIDANSK